MTWSPHLFCFIRDNVKGVGLKVAAMSQSNNYMFCRKVFFISGVWNHSRVDFIDLRFSKINEPVSLFTNRAGVWRRLFPGESCLCHQFVHNSYGQNFTIAKGQRTSGSAASVDFDGMVLLALSSRDLHLTRTVCRNKWTNRCITRVLRSKWK